jgi:hypothetical protein
MALPSDWRDLGEIQVRCFRSQSQFHTHDFDEVSTDAMGEVASRDRPETKPPIKALGIDRGLDFDRSLMPLASGSNADVEQPPTETRASNLRQQEETD